MSLVKKKETEPILQAKNITKVYRRTGKDNIRAVDNISFEVFPGEVVGVLGPNGAGKSTAIKLITGIANLTSGKISILNYDISTERVKAMKYVGGVIESPDMYLNWSGYDNLRYLASLHPRETMEEDNSKTALLSKKELDKKRIEETLALVGMTERKKDSIKKYSLGMKQRLGIAQALLNKPKLLVLDEPANGLDPAGIKDIRDMVKKLAHEYKMGILVSSHQLAEMQLMCDRVLIINKGKIVAEKSINALYGSEQGETIVLTVDNPEKASQIIKEKFQIDCEINEQALYLKNTSKKISDITRELVLGGVNVFGVQTKQSTLEEVFMNLTKGGSINV